MSFLPFYARSRRNGDLYLYTPDACTSGAVARASSEVFSFGAFDSFVAGGRQPAVTLITEEDCCGAGELGQSGGVIDSAEKGGSS